MPTDGVTTCSHDDIMTFEEIVAFMEQLQRSFDVTKVRLTGGDPLARKGIVSLVSELSKLEIPDLAMTTNAQQLSARAAELHDAGLSRVNISLDSLNPVTFRQITCGGEVSRTLDGIQVALQAGLNPLKLNMVVMRGINDDEVCEVLSFAMERGCELRFLELMPIGYGAELFDDAFISSKSVRTRLSSQFDLEPLHVECGSSAKLYLARTKDGLRGVVGFISPCSEPFCSGCTRLRLTADGRLLGCLAREEGLPIRRLLADADGAALSAAVRRSLQGKRSDQHFEQPAVMAAIGG